MQTFYPIMADFVLISHLLFVAFVIIGLIVTVIGGALKWRWIRNFWFRMTHLAAIGIVVAQVIADLACPLTTLEMWLRTLAGESPYQSSFIQHWLHQLLYYHAPAWVFVTTYCLFGLLVALAWTLYPPQFKSRRRTTGRSRII